MSSSPQSESEIDQLVDPFDYTSTQADALVDYITGKTLELELHGPQTRGRPLFQGADANFAANTGVDHANAPSAAAESSDDEMWPDVAKDGARVEPSDGEHDKAPEFPDQDEEAERAESSDQDEDQRTESSEAERTESTSGDEEADDNMDVDTNAVAFDNDDMDVADTNLLSTSGNRQQQQRKSKRVIPKSIGFDQGRNGGSALSSRSHPGRERAPKKAAFPYSPPKRPRRRKSEVRSRKKGMF